MTAALRLVDEPRTTPGEERDRTDHHTEHQERLLIGALLHLPAAQAHRVLDLLPDTAIRDCTARWALQLIRVVARAGSDADPVTLLGASRRHGPGGTATANTHQRHQLMQYLLDAADSAPNVADPLRAILAARKLYPPDVTGAPRRPEPGHTDGVPGPGAGRRHVRLVRS